MAAASVHSSVYSNKINDLNWTLRENTQAPRQQSAFADTQAMMDYA
jgi:hypothetical protein